MLVLPLLNRILRGEIKVAEVTSRFSDVDAFVSFISSFGFELRSKVWRAFNL